MDMMIYNASMLIAIGLCFILFLIVFIIAKNVSKVKAANVRFNELCPEVEDFFAELDRLSKGGYISLAQKESFKNRYEHAFTGAVSLEKEEMPLRIRQRIKLFLSDYRKIDELIEQHNIDCRK